ncbi:MAG: hypothetical protein WD876_03940 [Candidatus Pacearchaeota archaeon]
MSKTIKEALSEIENRYFQSADYPQDVIQVMPFILEDRVGYRAKNILTKETHPLTGSVMCEYREISKEEANETRKQYLSDIYLK